MIKTIKGVFLILMLDCEQSARLTSESFERPLTRWERVALKIHQRCCRSSDRVARQMEMMTEAFQNNRNQLSANPLPEDRLSDDARERIRMQLRDMN